jgi:acetyl-CoA synthetase
MGTEGQADDAASCPCEPMDSEQLLYLLYTSGTTAKPKGIVHTTARYLVGVASTHHYIFDIKPDSVYWCAADVGWVTGHSYIVYGPLTNGTTGVLYEGVPNFPNAERWWEIIERYKVVYTAPTAIRSHMKWGPEHAAKHDLSSLRLLGSVGEPINPEAWIWYREHIGGDRTPIVDTWWQTETGMIMITPLPGVTTTKPGSATNRSPASPLACSVRAGTRSQTGKAAATSCSSDRGPRCCAASTRMTSAIATHTGRSTTGSTSPVKVRASTRTGTTGCSAESTT